MMARTQVSMSRESQRRAQRRAAELGISFAEYMRRLVEQDLHRPRRTADRRAVFDLGDSGGSDIALDKDALIGAALSANGMPKEHPRRAQQHRRPRRRQ